jgi:hypothetical protein
MRRSTTMLLCVVLVLVFAAPAGATTTKVEVSGTAQVLGVIDEGRTWMSGSILHVRGQVLSVLHGPTALSQGGPAESTVNLNLDERTGHGRAWGTLRVDYLDGGGFEASFTGSIRPDASVPGGLIGEYRVVGSGWGTYAGQQLRATGTEYLATGQQFFTAVVFTPGDR